MPLPVHRRRTAFTLIELMVVVAILGAMLALVIPATQHLSRSADAAVERGAARQVVAAWRAWSFDHQGQLLPGRVDTSVTGPLSPNESPVVFNGLPVDQEARVRWLWRLVPYLDDPIKALWTGTHEEFHRHAIDTGTEGYYLATLHPSFGLNAEWIGGMQSNDSDTWTLTQFIQSQDEGARPLFADTLSRLRKPADLVAFASSRGMFSSTQGGAGRPVEGYWRLIPPWRINAGGTEPAWALDEHRDWVVPDEASDPAASGFVSARHGGRVLVASPDGSVTLTPFEVLTDMQRWSDDATHRDWAPSLP